MQLSKPQQPMANKVFDDDDEDEDPGLANNSDEEPHGPTRIPSIECNHDSASKPAETRSPYDKLLGLNEAGTFLLSHSRAVATAAQPAGQGCDGQGAPSGHASQKCRCKEGCISAQDRNQQSEEGAAGSH